MMIKRSTWILLAVFVVLVGAWLLTQRKAGETTLTAEPTQSVTLLNSDSSSITRVEITNQQGQMVTVTQNDQQWEVQGPTTESQATITPGNIAEMTSTLASTSVLATLEGNLPAEETGLNAPSYVIKAAGISGKVSVIKVGKLTPTGSGYYAQVDDGDTLVVGRYNIDRVVELALVGNPTAAPPAGTITPAP